ncbi:uncharacterized protein LOC142977619 [Anticarsia gemmatalis]|uniref:uncharacterized protein LOC142977619 n=1 Tax=Anticarsia gemmatalis TaxID=129554 RepID=UPI003F75FD2D
MMGLEDLLSECDDLNEPSCMDKILMYLEEIKEEDDMFMEALLDKLRAEEITWEQPWYQQNTSISRPLKERCDNKKEETYRTDTICKEENKLILKNWHELIAEYDIPDKLICLARWKNKDKSRLPNTPEERVRRFVVSYLARGLQRTSFQIFRHIQTYYGGPVKGHYSEAEERIMKVCFKHHPNNAVVLLSMVLGREPRGIYKRLQQLYNGKPVKKRIKWNLDLATKFLKLLMKYTGLPLEELKNRRFDKEVWLKLGKKFDQHYIYLQSFWYDSLHVQLFVKSSVKIKKLRKKALKIILESPYQIWSDIRWKDVIKHFPDGFTHRFLYKLCRNLVYKKRKYLKRPLADVVSFAFSNLKNGRKRRLRTVRLNEQNELEAVVYNKLRTD